MPCNSDHMNATAAEVEFSRVFQLLDIVEGRRKKVNPSAWDGYDRRVYCVDVTKAEKDHAMKTLCDACKKLGPKMKDQVLELQVWWRDHQADDRRRAEAKATEKARKKKREAALAKLSPADRKALDLE